MPIFKFDKGSNKKSTLQGYYNVIILAPNVENDLIDLQTLELAILSAVLGFVYVDILSAPGMILAWLQRLIDRTPLSHLFQCPYCLAGQIALWSYPAFYWHSYLLTNHFLTIIIAIFTARIFVKYLSE